MASKIINRDGGDPRLSPHTLQNSSSQYIHTEFTRKNRLLDAENSPRSTYIPSTDETESTTVHYGRRQLLINEIEFLTICISSLEKEMNKEWRKRKIIVFYGGSSPGLHLLILAHFFPLFKFILVDPQPVIFKYGKKSLRENFEFYQQKFERNLAERFYEKYKDNTKYIRLFVSDIRSTNDDEQIIRDEHKLQAELHRILKAYKSHLKFRLPYVSTNSTLKTTYLDGDVYFLIWGRPRTTETRLVVDENCQEKDYDCAKYQDQLHHFNKNERTFCYLHDVNEDGLDHCYDCRAEVFVFENYTELNGISDMSLKTKGQCVNYVNHQLQSSMAGITLEIRLNQYLYKGKYFFTRIRHGTIIENENQLKNVLNHEPFKKILLKNEQAKNYLDVIANMGNLNIKD